MTSLYQDKTEPELRALLAELQQEKVDMQSYWMDGQGDEWTSLLSEIDQVERLLRNYT